MDRKPIDLTGRRAPPAGRLSNAPWPLANASMTDGRRKMQDVNQVLCLMEAISEDWKLILIPEDEVMGPEFEEKRLKARAIELNEKRKMINLDLFFIQAYLYYFGNYNVSYIEMKKALSGRLIATDKFLDDVETVLKICQEEPSELSTFKDKFRWNDYRDRLLRNRYKSVFPGYGVVAKVLRYQYDFDIDRWQLALIINGFITPNQKLKEALNEIIEVAKKHIIFYEFGEKVCVAEPHNPIESDAGGEWYVPIMLGNDSAISRFFKLNKMEKYCKLHNKKMQSGCAHDMSISTIWDIQKAFILAEDTFSSVLIYSNEDFVDEDYKRLIYNYSWMYNIPVKIMFRNRIVK